MVIFNSYVSLPEGMDLHPLKKAAEKNPVFFSDPQPGIEKTVDFWDFHMFDDSPVISHSYSILNSPLSSMI